MSNPGLNGFSGPQPAVTSTSVPSMNAVLNDLRAKIFSSANHELKREVIDFFGSKIEVRQPTLSEAIDMSMKQDEMGSATLFVLTHFCYVPGTDQRVFSDADNDSLKGLPAGKWVQDLGNAFSRVQGTSVETTEKNLGNNPS